MHTPEAELESGLAEAKKRLAEILNAGPKPANLHEISAAQDAVAAAQRSLAAARGQERAVPLDIGFELSSTAASPLLLQTDKAVFLTFRATRALPDGRRQFAGHGVVEFDGCSVTKFGYPNDEALAGHPLYERGLRPYGVFDVPNSSWTRELTAQNRVSFPKTPDSTKRHFIFTFHDNTFECVARGLQASLSEKPPAEIFADARKRLFKMETGG
jgi:hypothetical protein